MAGAAAAHALTGVAIPAPPGRFGVSLATAADEPDVRRLLREHPLAGDVVVSLEREPSSRVAAGIEGDLHQTLVARERTSNRIAAIASRAVRDGFINGVPARVGYLGQLRIAKDIHAYREILESGFAFCRELHEAGDARVYLSSVVAENHAARRLLVGMRSRSAPHFQPVGALSTLILPRSRQRVRLRGLEIEIRQGSRDLLEEIAACLWRNGARRQFAPCWRAEDLCAPPRTPDLRPEDLFVATCAGRIVGCIACWDQRRFKQVVVRGYSPRLRRWRPIANLAAPWLGCPRLPEVGRRLEFAYLSHFAVDKDDVATALSLIDAARGGMPADVDYAVMGIAEGSSLLPALRRHVRHREYRSVLYLTYWPDGERIARALDGRLPHAEVAVL